jgi:hypothetical protein
VHVVQIGSYGFDSEPSCGRGRRSTRGAWRLVAPLRAPVPKRYDRLRESAVNLVARHGVSLEHRSDRQHVGRQLCQFVLDDVGHCTSSLSSARSPCGSGHARKMLPRTRRAPG